MGQLSILSSDFPPNFPHGISRRNYPELVGKLADIGVMDSEPNIRNKISRGKFTAVFLVQCLEAIEANEIRL
jgi:hypothetical protein